MLDLISHDLGDRRLRVVATDRSDGDVHPVRTEPDVLTARQVAATGAVWSMTDQVHGTAVHHVTSGPRSPGEATSREGRRIDALPVADVQVVDRATAVSGVRVATWAADCATLTLAARSGRFVALHAGWRGLADGVLDVGVDALAEPVAIAVLGPTIGPCCYEFGASDLAVVAAGVGVAPAEVAALDRRGRTALDVPTAVTRGLARRGVALDVIGPCTGCDERWFSHRVRGEPGRHATISWMEPSVTAPEARR